MAVLPFTISTFRGKEYTGLHNKAASLSDAERVAKDSIRYAAHYYAGTKLSDFHAVITTNGREIKTVKV